MTQSIDGYGLDGQSVLITGGGGQLASDLRQRLGEVARVSAPSRAELDIADDDALAEAFERLRPDLVLNCAAFHNVEVCEREEDRSFEVNARAVKRLAERCTEGGARLVHLSTNYVFSGAGERPWTEADLPDPRSIYAISKLAGEQTALAYCPDALVARTSGLYGLHGSASKGGNFVNRMLGRAREQGELRMVADQRLTPTFTGDLADGLLAALTAGVTGVVHLTASGACSWHEFTVAIMELAGVDVPVEPVATTRPPGGADRPLNGVLDGQRLRAAGLPPLRDWREALEDYMGRAGLLQAAGPAGRYTSAGS